MPCVAAVCPEKIHLQMTPTWRGAMPGAFVLWPCPGSAHAAPRFIPLAWKRGRSAGHGTAPLASHEKICLQAARHSVTIDMECKLHLNVNRLNKLKPMR